MQKIQYSPFKNEAENYWKWHNDIPVVPVPKNVATEGAGSEMRTPLMHFGVILPVYMSIIRYLSSIELKKGMRLIELGSGSGRVLTYIKTLFPELEVWGVDYSKAGVEYAKATYGKYGVKFKHTPAQDTSLKTGHFDFVISSHVIEHVTKEEGLAFMKEVSRLLKKGGYAFIGTPERRQCQGLYAKNPTDAKKDRLVPPHEHEYTAPELLSLAQEVFPKANVRVDLLVNPIFRSIFSSSIHKFKPKGSLLSSAVNFAYRTFRDQAPRPLFDTVTRVGVNQQMKKLGHTFHDVLLSNSIAPYSKKVADNLLLVCKK